MNYFDIKTLVANKNLPYAMLNEQGEIIVIDWASAQHEYRVTTYLKEGGCSHNYYYDNDMIDVSHNKFTKWKNAIAPEYMYKHCMMSPDKMTDHVSWWLQKLDICLLAIDVDADNKKQYYVNKNIETIIAFINELQGTNSTSVNQEHN